MISPASGARAALLAAAIGVSFAWPAQAADMPFFTPPPMPLSDAPAELGTGWYLRGDVGYANVSSPTIIADLVNSNKFTGAVSGGLGAGYQYNSWLRTEIALDRSVLHPESISAPIWCPYANHPLSSQSNGVDPVYKLGYGVDPNETCIPKTSATLTRTTGLFNAYFDLGNWYGLTPYVGAGVGATYLRSNGGISYYKTSDGSPYTADLSPVEGYPLIWVNKWTGLPVAPQPILAFAQQNWNCSLSKGSWKFAWALFAGFSYDVTQNLKIDVGYRYLNSGKYVGLPGAAGASPVGKELVSHEVRLGVRLMAD